MRRIVIALVCAVLFSTSLSGQTSPSNGQPVRDPQALDTVQAALNALGGVTAIGQTQSWQIQGQEQVTMPDGTSVSGTFTWESDGVDFRIALTSSTNSSYVVSGDGNPAYVTTGATSGTAKVPGYVSSAIFVPALVGYLLSQQLQNTNCPLSYAGPAKLGSEGVTVVKTRLLTATNADPHVNAQTWYFDNVSHLPVKIEFRLPSQQSPLVSATGSVVLSNYQQVSGVLYPFTIGHYFRDKLVSVSTVQAVNVNATISSSDYQAPVGGAQ